MALAYTRELIRNEDSTWFARVVELNGCMTEGETKETALASLEEAMATWIETALEDGVPIPEPMTTEKYSGKFLVRLPKTLHRDLVRRAEKQDVSLNQLVLTALAKIVT